MTIDKSWMQIRDRCLPEYEKGIDEFIAFAFGQPGVGNEIRCPCTKCRNVMFKKKDDIKLHLFRNGIDTSYLHWFHHGEEYEETTSDDEDNVEEELPHHDMTGMINDIYAHMNNQDANDADVDVDEDSENMGGHANTSTTEKPNKEAEKYYTLLEECEQPLYPNCHNFSKLSFMVRLLNLKCLHGWSDTGFTSLLELLLEAFPSAQIPPSYYEARKIITTLGHHYEKIDACKNDCILYWKEFADLKKCPICGTSRWINGENGDKPVSTSTRRKKIPHKVLRYFPLTPRLKRLFLNSSTASAMRWHKEKRNDDGLLRHPADSLAWKTFDDKYANFARDSRNVRLALASDGFNPFGNMSVTYSMWPVILIPYNLPPWVCMKSPYFMMSLLIPGPKAPGNDIDVYLQPLIDELKYLWENGVEAYDAYGKQNFQLHAALLWTINDFPAYANLSGWSTKGALACPCCNKDTVSDRLTHGRKECYMGHRRFLPMNHRWRNDMKAFNGKKEKRIGPKQLSGKDILDEFDGYEQIIFGKNDSKKRKKKDSDLPYNWKKKSIFFSLPYWKTLLIRHNLDVMHIEKNICDNILGTLMGVENKTKDNLNARLDMENMNIRKELWPHRDEEGNIECIPVASYTLSRTEKLRLCEFFSDLKVPDGYSSNISRCVNLNDCKIINLKSHDCHVILHRYLPLAIRGLLPKEVSEALIELSAFYRELCGKVLDTKDLDRLEAGIVITLCKLERIFPPAFFDVMVHLSVHLASEAKIAGPVQYRWMFVVERFLKILKSYVRNKARPEGSIAEGYIAQECLNFCSHYLKGVDTKLNRAGRNYEEISSQNSGLSIFWKSGFHLKAPVHDVLLSTEEWMHARMYVLKNCDEVMPFIVEHKEAMLRENKSNSIRRHEEKFPDWLHQKVDMLLKQGSSHICEQLLHLAQGPNKRVTRYTGYVVNGFRFHSKDYEEARRMKTQNSGVVVKGDESIGSREYFGVLNDIIELSYNGGNKVILFKCHWWDVYNQGRGYKEDQYGCFMINVTRELKSDEPYILACQAEQVYYVKDNKDPKWHVVVKTRPRDLFEMLDLSKRCSDEDDPVDEPIQENELIGRGFQSVDNDNDASLNLSRYNEIDSD